MDDLEDIKKKYITPSIPASFMEIGAFYDQLDSKTKQLFSKAEVKKALMKDEYISIMKDSPRKHESIRVLVPRISYMWEADIGMYKREISSHNEGYIGFLAVIDAFSKYLWCKPLKDTKGKTVSEAFEKIILQSDKVCTNCRTDLGPEFKSHEFQNLMTKYGINHFFANGPRKACIIERAIATLKMKISRYLVHSNSWEWYKILDDMVSSYNYTKHSVIGIPPAKVSEADENRIWRSLYEDQFAHYLKEEPIHKIMKTEEGKEIPQQERLNDYPNYKFKLGDRVRLNISRYQFMRKYDIQWSQEIFTVVDRFTKEDKNLYTLKDYNNELVSGSFFEGEMLRAYVNEDTVYRISSIKRKRGGKYLVSWSGWGSKFDSWLDKDQLQDISKE